MLDVRWKFKEISVSYGRNGNAHSGDIKTGSGITSATLPEEEWSKTHYMYKIGQVYYVYYKLTSLQSASDRIT